MKALLVVGSAPCALDDLAKAQQLHPDHEVMLVNGACTLVERAEHMLAGHTSKAREFKWARQSVFPDAPMPQIHASWVMLASKRNPHKDRVPRREFPMVDVWWPAEVSSGATSAGKAALIGLRMGFDVVVLCGCPMDGSGYHPLEAKTVVEAGCQRVGDPKMQARSTIRRYRDRMANLAMTHFKGRVFSMSGYTRQVLGAPPGEARRARRAAAPDMDLAGWLA